MNFNFGQVNQVLFLELLLQDPLIAKYIRLSRAMMHASARAGSASTVPDKFIAFEATLRAVSLKAPFMKNQMALYHYILWRSIPDAQIPLVLAQLQDVHIDALEATPTSTAFDSVFSDNDELFETDEDEEADWADEEDDEPDVSDDDDDDDGDDSEVDFDASDIEFDVDVDPLVLDDEEEDEVDDEELEYARVGEDVAPNPDDVQSILDVLEDGDDIFREIGITGDPKFRAHQLAAAVASGVTRSLRPSLRNTAAHHGDYSRENDPSASATWHPNLDSRSVDELVQFIESARPPSTTETTMTAPSKGKKKKRSKKKRKGSEAATEGAPTEKKNSSRAPSPAPSAFPRFWEEEVVEDASFQRKMEAEVAQFSSRLEQIQLKATARLKLAHYDDIAKFSRENPKNLFRYLYGGETTAETSAPFAGAKARDSPA